jgi:lysophospholipase L1-like esterase
MTSGQWFGASARNMQTLYGFSKPYNFDRALPFVAAAGLVVVVVVAGAVGAALGGLSWGTFRCVFLIYLFAMALSAAAIAFIPRWSWLLSGLCCLELLLGFGSQLLADVHLFVRVPLLPLNDSLNAPQQLQFHPLLQKVPSPNFLRETPFAIRHNSVGLRGPERDRQSLLRQIVVAALGGSSTYDVALPNGQTWTDDLERLLGSKYAVLNHGVTGYSTSEHVLQTAFYLDAYDVKPQCAVYYIGYNDIHNAYLPHLDRGYADYHMLLEEQDLQRHTYPTFARVSPLARIFVPWVRYLLTPTPLAQEFSSTAYGHGRDVRLENIYRSNIEAIATLNRSRQVTTIFIGQIVNRAKIKDMKAPWMPLIRDSDFLPLVSRFNRVLADSAKTFGVPVFIPPLERFDDGDFADNVHFSRRGAERFAAMLEPIVKMNCRK